MKRPTERRKHKRFQPMAGLFVFLSSEAINISHIKYLSMTEITLRLFKSQPIKMGQIIDISRGGLSFGYIYDEANLNEVFELAITYAEKGFYSNMMKFETVSDTKTANGDRFDALKIRRQGLKFKELTLRQNSLLDHAIQNYTVGEVDPYNFFANQDHSSLMISA